jgi:uncharacterized protein with ParB-like and HNH nuclease domain
LKSTLSAHETPLEKVFSDDYVFNIPSVQRPYSWSSKEIGELLDDLLEYIDQHDIQPNNINQINAPYFLGSIVLVKHEGEREADVLDGQQRLTSLTILLAVLRDYIGSELQDELDSFIVQKGNKIRNIHDTFRLNLRNKDNDFFIKYVQQRGGTNNVKENIKTKTDSQQLIKENVQYLYDRLNALDQSTVEILPSVFATLCYVVIVSTPNFDSAFRIFTVLNDRGLDLLPSDIFKAKVIGEIPSGEQGKYTQVWEDIEISLGRNDFNKLFEYTRMIIQKRKGSANLKDEYDLIFKDISGKNFINEVLIPYSEEYEKLLNFRTHFEDQSEILRLLSLMKRLDNKDWMPVAMYYIKKSGRDLNEFFSRLEALAGTAMILRKNFNWRMSKYSQILKEIDMGVDIFSSSSALEVSEDDKAELVQKLNGDVYTDLKDTARRYLLLKLDSLLTSGQPYYDHSVITVEHVLPQNPASDSVWNKEFKDPEKYVHKLGNLVLLTRAKNAQARNYDFDKKREKYLQPKNGMTTFALTTQVLQTTSWTPKTIEKRQETLVHMLIDSWALEKAY